MKIFISWSGDLSKSLGEALKSWLPAVLQSVRPYFTPSDIEKGASWPTEISKHLEESKIGIMCMTRESLSSSWMMFEAGALSKHLGKSYVCPLLFNIENTDIKGPLAHFQSTQFNKADIKKLLETINSQSDIKLESHVLNDVFEMWWPRLESEVEQIISAYKPENKDDENKRSDRDLLEEILEISRTSLIKSRRDSRMIQPGAIEDLVEIRNKLRYLGAKDPSLLEIISEMDRPVKRILTRIRDTDEDLFHRLRRELIKPDYLNDDSPEAN